jgi:hypothetical protein
MAQGHEVGEGREKLVHGYLKFKLQIVRLEPTNLVVFKAVQKCNAESGSWDTESRGEGRELQAFHFNISHACSKCPPQILEFVRLRVVAQCAIDTPLALVEAVGA